MRQPTGKVRATRVALVTDRNPYQAPAGEIEDISTRAIVYPRVMTRVLIVVSDVFCLFFAIVSLGGMWKTALGPLEAPHPRYGPIHFAVIGIGYLSPFAVLWGVKAYCNRHDWLPLYWWAALVPSFLIFAVWVALIAISPEL